VLAEFARAKQLANAVCEIRDGVVYPTEDSGKLPVLLDKLDTHGIRKTDPEPGARAIVASESQRMVRMVAGWLRKQGLNVEILDGTVVNKKGDPARDRVIDWYKEPSGDARVLVMTMQTGGVGLNLGMTGSMHVLDETWNPDDSEQLEDRGMRNRTTPLVVYYYRTEDSIQEYIQQIGFDKKITNKNVMDYAQKLKQRTG
jgi:SNF2 family DNA or RNA helicase